jgi:HEAT repeat protein
MRKRQVVLLAAALALGGCGKAPPTLAHGKPVAHWVQALQDPDVRVRRKAADVLGNVGAVDGAVVPALARAVKDRDVGVRRAAVLALLKIGPGAREAAPVLEEAGKDRDGRVGAYAAQALRKVRGGV